MMRQATFALLFLMGMASAGPWDCCGPAYYCCNECLTAALASGFYDYNGARSACVGRECALNCMQAGWYAATSCAALGGWDNVYRCQECPPGWYRSDIVRQAGCDP